MNIEFEAQLLEKLGFTVEPDNLTEPSVKDDHGWVITHPGWHQERQCESRSDIALWLYSRGVSAYPQYLAILRFRDILSAADHEIIEGLRSWGAGSRVTGAAEVVVDEVLRLSQREVVLPHDVWRSLAFELLAPQIQRRYLSLGMHMGLEFEVFMRSRALDAEPSEGLISCLWKRFRDGIQGLGRRIAGLAE
ncbi:hypothetical protein [Xanthomonas arboricola]|uniref:hypothetical protein n=1 Tax=Xanthomonas arboricola TaxID=56448 RepID=UPI0012DB217A|nr:hypothetical protein [Xanthomonas arboricola]